MNDRIQQLIDMALAEDVGTGDVTSASIIDEGRTATGTIVAKEPLVLAGLGIARRVFETVDPSMAWDAKKQDGAHCESGTTLAVVKAKARALLSGERTALNFVQHLSGVATLTSVFVHICRKTNVQILDTRKTTPGWRALEKYAVKVGGGTNHRMGLFDHFLIKNNHIAVAGSVSDAIALAKTGRQSGQLLEVEARNISEVKEALEGAADVIMLDNMTPGQVREMVKLVHGRAKLEVSGGVKLESVLSFAETGVDYISVGALTHSAPAVDIHMLIKVE